MILNSLYINRVYYNALFFSMLSAFFNAGLTMLASIYLRNQLLVLKLLKNVQHNIKNFHIFYLNNYIVFF